MAAMASQSLMNLVDAAMVGSLGGEALAGVGLGGYASFIAISMVIGLGAGVQAMVARRKGERDRANYAVPLNAGLVLGLAFAIPISVIFALASAPMMAFLAPTAGVAEVGSDYFDMRLLSVWAVAMNFSVVPPCSASKSPALTAARTRCTFCSRDRCPSSKALFWSAVPICQSGMP